ncbi:MAG: NAD-dependent epimerase/dehydratase family protein [Flavobacteriales bacterium]|nr:NAD-dependent epimerase/dehydratase family protein [Flavobacteriales bacterium]
MNVLVIGASGQIGIELVQRLRKQYGNDSVVASDIRPPVDESLQEGPYEILNVLNDQQLFDIVKKYKIELIYHLAAMLSATGEQKPEMAWDLNMNGLFHVLDLAKEGHIKRVFWPSSIAVFGPSTPKNQTPQFTITEPTTVYGISKLSGERWCEYYNQRWGVDVRSLRYPGLLGYKSLPGGGTTDYAVDIFHQAIEHNSYTCFLKEDTALPMMYMDDAIAATIQIAEAPEDQIKIKSSYNLGGISFSPKDLTQQIQVHVPEFQIQYEPDFRQAIADSWPNSIDDQSAQDDWNWKANFNLKKTTAVMLEGVAKKKGLTETI